MTCRLATLLRSALGSRTGHGLQLTILAAMLLSCASGYHSPIVSPRAPSKVEADYDFTQIDKYRSDVAAYRAFADGDLALLAASSRPLCASRQSKSEPKSLAFCHTGTGQLAVEVLDANGDLAASSALLVTIGSEPAGLIGVTTANTNGGTATFRSLYAITQGTFTLTADGGTLKATGLSIAVRQDLDRAKGIRNRIIEGFMGDIDHVFGEYSNALYVGKGVQALEGDVVSLGLTAASTITLGERAKTTLSAIATAVTGINVSFDKNLFGQQTFGALAIAMQARRDTARKSIVTNEQLSVTDYPLEAAQRELTAYFFSGTLPGAIQEIQEEAALKSSEATKSQPSSETTPSGPRLVIGPASGKAGTPVSVVVQVLDASGAIDSKSTADITLTIAPKDVAEAKDGVATAKATGGIATFSLTFQSVTTYSLVATSPGLSKGTATLQIVGSNQPIPAPAPTPTKPPRQTDGIH